MTNEFVVRDPELEDYWRGLVLFGRNVASYKFALAKALLDLKPAGGQLLTLEELAEPFASHIGEHLRLADKQGTSRNSRFLDACRKANADELTREDLVGITVRLGFNNVIDAFHVIGGSAIPTKFFLDERKARTCGIRITDEFSLLLERIQAPSLIHEAESRWRLVETAWELGISRNVVIIDHDATTESLIAIDRTRKRRSVTGARPALNGYQRGKCFYCFGDIFLDGSELPDVDHFFPYKLKIPGGRTRVDGIWNLVLACRRCNRGPGGKFDSVPASRLVSRLHRRNEFLIDSHHPLRETLMLQTGSSKADRREFLSEFYSTARATLIHEWHPVEVARATF